MTGAEDAGERGRAMKKVLLVCCLVLAFAATASASLDTLWIRTYGGSHNDGFRSAIATSDGANLAVGYTYSFGPANSNVFAVKVDDNGDTLWMRTYGGAGLDYGYGVCETADGNYVITGYTTSSGAGKEDVYVIKIDAQGDTVWTRTYGGPEPDEGRGICATSDGCVVVTGRTDSYGEGNNDLYLLKIDADGDTVWTRVFGSTRLDWGTGVCLTQDGNYAACGSSDEFTGDLNMYLVKVDPAGNLLWENHYGGTGYNEPDWATDIEAVADTELIVSGNTAIEGRDPSQGCFLRVNPAGTQLGFRKYLDPYYEYATSICGTPDGGNLFCGSDKRVADQTNDLLIYRRPAAGGFAIEQVMGGDGCDWGSSIVQAHTGIYLIAGHTESSGAGGFDGWLLYLAEPGAGIGDRASSAGALLAAPSPNPVSSSTSLRFGIADAGQVRLAVYDGAGRQVALIEDRPLGAGQFTRVWDGTGINGRRVSPGVYVVRLEAGGLTSATKLVVLR
jgi:hypothetical protein